MDGGYDYDLDMDMDSEYDSEMDSEMDQELDSEVDNENDIEMEEEVEFEIATENGFEPVDMDTEISNEELEMYAEPLTDEEIMAELELEAEDKAWEDYIDDLAKAEMEPKDFNEDMLEYMKEQEEEEIPEEDIILHKGG